MSGYTPKCDCCGRFFRAGQPGSSWSQSWSWDMGGTPDLHDPTDRCAPCTDLYGVEPSNCANPENYSGRHALEGRLPMTPPETSDQGNMVSQREGECDAALDFVRLVSRLSHSGDDGYSGSDDPDDDLHALDRLIATAREIDLRPLRAVLAEALSAAPPPEPRADEGGDIGYPTPLGALQFRMEQGGHTQADLARLIGSRSRAAEILAGKRGLSKAHIRVLADEWGIPARSLLGPATCALAAEASPLGAEPGATGIDRGRDEQITQPSHDDEGLIEEGLSSARASRDARSSTRPEGQSVGGGEG